LVRLQHGELASSPAPVTSAELAGVDAGSGAQPNPTWRVGSLHPTTVKALTALGFAIPVGIYLAVLARYQVNAIFSDEWSDVHVVVQNYGHFPDWSSLWALHNDNRCCSRTSS